MEISRSFVLVLALHLSVFNSLGNVSSLKKKKSLNKPHGRHVANKRGWSSLFEPHGGNSSRPNISPVVVKGENVFYQDTKLPSQYSHQSVQDEKKRRRRKKKNMKLLKKKLRDDLKLYSPLGNQHVQSYPKRKCRNWNQCKKDECCIRFSSTSGYCKRRPQRGYRCRPVLLPGLRDCPCDSGLTCTLYKTTKLNFKKYKCERLKFDEDELQEQRFVWILLTKWKWELPWLEKIWTLGSRGVWWQIIVIIWRARQTFGVEHYASHKTVVFHPQQGLLVAFQLCSCTNRTNKARNCCVESCTKVIHSF